MMKSYFHIFWVFLLPLVLVEISGYDHQQQEVEVEQHKVVVHKNTNCQYRTYGNCRLRHIVSQPVTHTVTQVVQEPIRQVHVDTEVHQHRTPVRHTEVVSTHTDVVKTQHTDTHGARYLNGVRIASPCSSHNVHCHDVPSKVSLRITECPPGHYLTPDGTHCKHTDCSVGLKFDDHLLKCVDIDECVVQHPCKHDEHCVNTHGSYYCKKICTQAGYRLNPLTNTCDDVNECVEGTHHCGPQQICVNRLGGHDCECPKGFRINGRHCDDIDECHLHPNICPRETSRCHNIPGDYSCVCKTGFRDDGSHKNCLDIDECLDHNGGCSHTCVNKFGSHECHCPKGFELSHDHRTCVDVDECSKYGHGHLCSKETSICINTPGSYVCECKIGFRDDGTHKHCVDINECAEHTHKCQQNCLNTFGSYKCGCHQGYRLVDLYRCEDIDECHEGEFINSVAFSRFRADNGKPKLCHGHCENTLGSYLCTCPHGYTLESGHHCVDIDECKSHCQGNGDICVNLAGGYRCVQIHCPNGYYRDGHQCKRSRVLDYQHLDQSHVDQVVCYSYSHIPFRANHRIPSSGSLEFYTFVVPIEHPVIADFDLKLVSAKSLRTDVHAALRDDFLLRRSKDNEVKIALLKPLQGPQDVELEILCKMFKNGVHVGTNKAIVNLYVSEYDF